MDNPKDNLQIPHSAKHTDSVNVKASVKSSRKGKGNLQALADQKKSVNQQSLHQNQQNGDGQITINDQKDENLLTIQDVLKQDKDENVFEDGRETNALFSDYIVIEAACSSLNLMSVLLTVIEFDLEYHERNEYIAKTMCYVITVTSVLSIFLTFLRFQSNLDWMIARKVVEKKETLFSTGLIWQCAAEIILVTVGPTPWTVHQKIYFTSEPAGKHDLYYHVNEILSLILMLRGLLIFRTFLMMSQWYNNRSQRVCRLYACDSDLLFVIKCIMKSSPYKIVSFAFTCSIFYFGYMIRVCEAPLLRQEGQNFLSYYNALWNIIITMTTVGYGDFYPQTHLGRFVIFCVSIWGVFIVSIMVVTMMNTLNTSNLENKAIAVLERLFVRDQMRDSASTVVTTLGKISIEKKKQLKGVANPKESQQKETELAVKLSKAINEYKRINRTYRSICDDNISEEMSRQFDFMREEFNQLFSKQTVVLEANVDIMKHLRMDNQVIQRFQDIIKHNKIEENLEDDGYEFDDTNQQQQEQLGGNNDFHDIFKEQQQQQQQNQPQNVVKQDKNIKLKTE